MPSTPALPPYALALPRFRFRALASLAGRAPLGGAREVALASFLAARLVDDAVSSRALPQPARAARSLAARAWLSALTLPAAVRAPLARLIDASGDGDPATIKPTIDNVIAVTAPFLDPPALLELRKLAQAFAG